ncbi:MAG: thioredoxin family protein [Vulcanibacillus sp.]
MIIKILGPGCQKCKVLYNQVMRVEKDLEREDDVIKVEDYKEIMKYNILSTPGLVIDDKVLCVGRIASTEEIKKWIKERDYNEKI